MIKYFLALLVLACTVVVLADRETNVRAQCSNNQSIFQTEAPSTNGCGVEPYTLSDLGLDIYDFEECCNAHDICYADCTSTKLRCDEDFYACMRNICIEDDDFGCDETACGFYQVVLDLGERFYRNAVEDHCDCSGDGSLEFVTTEDVEVRDCEDTIFNDSSSSSLQISSLFAILSFVVLAFYF